MNLPIWQLILIIICATTIWDIIRVLVFKVMAKRFRIFAIVPDTEQARLAFVANKLNVDVTNIVVEGNVFYDLDNPDEKYILTCVPAYVLETEAEHLANQSNKK